MIHRSLVLVAAAATLVGCGGPEATVVITDVADTDAVTAGDYEAESVEIESNGDWYGITIGTEEDEPCTSVVVSFCKEAAAGTLSPPHGEWSCDSGAGDLYQPSAFTLGVTVTCNGIFASWGSRGNDARLELDGDDVRFEFRGKLDGNGTTPGSFTLSVDASFAQDDAEASD